MTTQDILELAARCEAATGPYRELDAAIAEAVGYERDGTDFWIKGERYSIREPDYYELSGQVSELPYFSASLDAAKTLWPGEVPHLIPSDPRICTAMALHARAHTKGEE